MFNKKTAFRLCMLAVMFYTACSAETEREDSRTEKESAIKKSTEASPETTSAVMEGIIKIEKNLPDRDIKIPDYLKEEDEEDIYHLSGSEQAEIAGQIAEEIEDSINQVLADKDFYPDIIGISVNSECTEFNVTFSGRELSLYENTLPVSLCIVGDRFQLYQGREEGELMTTVYYTDADSGEIFNTVNSGQIRTAPNF